MLVESHTAQLLLLDYYCTRIEVSVMRWGRFFHDSIFFSKNVPGVLKRKQFFLEGVDFGGVGERHAPPPPPPARGVGKHKAFPVGNA